MMTPDEKRRWKEFDLQIDRKEGQVVSEVSVHREQIKEYLFGALKQYEEVHGKGPEEFATLSTKDGDYAIKLDDKGDITIEKKP